MDRRDFVAATSALGLVGGAATAAAGESTKLTPAMEQAREAALKVLKPTDRELEYGLRLHGESVVFDVYGFAPAPSPTSRLCGRRTTPVGPTPNCTTFGKKWG